MSSEQLDEAFREYFANSSISFDEDVLDGLIDEDMYRLDRR